MDIVYSNVQRSETRTSAVIVRVSFSQTSLTSMWILWYAFPGSTRQEATSLLQWAHDSSLCSLFFTVAESALDFIHDFMTFWVARIVRLVPLPKAHFSSNSIQPCGRLVCKQPHMAACFANVVVTCRGKRLEIAEMVCFKCFELMVAKSNCFLPVSPMMSYVHTQQEKLRKSAGFIRCP